MKGFITLASIAITYQVTLASLVPPLGHMQTDWTEHEVCQNDSRKNQHYCLQLLEFNKAPQNYQDVLVFIPGLIQNGETFDIMPEKNISMARHLAKRFNIKSYILNIRGIAKSDYIENSNLDDIVIDDIPAGLRFVFAKEKRKILLLGHSQGAITSQTSMAGLTRCGIGENCFRQSVAHERQGMVKGLILLAGNAAMTIYDDKNILRLVPKLYRSEKLQETLLKMDHIHVKKVLQSKAGAQILRFINKIFRMRNIDKDVRYALYHNTFDATSGKVLLQYADGIAHNGMHSIGGHSYAKNAKYITQIPVAQQTYENDYLAEHEATRKDSFAHIGSPKKYFEMLPEHGHSDVLLSETLHPEVDVLVQYVMDNPID